MPVIDADTHLYEPRGMWSDHLEAGRRHLALDIVDDEHGNAWLVHGDRRIEVLGIHEPGDVSQSGDFRQRLQAGLPPLWPYDDRPAEFTSPSARLGWMDRNGIDETISMANCGIMWERALGSDLESTMANMQAWNRWAAGVQVDGKGRIHPVGHVTLRDGAFAERQIQELAAAGITLAMVAPALVDGRRLSHPDHDRVWAAFEDAGVGVVFHVGQYPPGFDDAWNEGDPDWSNPLLSSVFLWLPPALAIADLAVRGVLARHPGLRIGVIELFSGWVPQFLASLDGGFSFHREFNGAPIVELEHRPSEYVRRQVCVASFAFERPARLAEQAGDMFMFGSDYPHPEGVPDPVDEFTRRLGTTPEAAPSFFHGNAARLLGRAPRPDATSEGQLEA